MPLYCCAYGCNSKSGKTEGVSFFTFPRREKSPSRFKAWVNRLNRKNFTPSNHTRICSRHFVEDDFELSSSLKMQLMPGYRNRKYLKKEAIPSQNLKGEGKTENKQSPKVKRRRKSTYPRKKIVQEACEEIKNLEELQILEEAHHSNYEDADGEELEFYLNENDKEIQCEMGREILRNLETESSIEENVDLDVSFCVSEDDVKNKKGDSDDDEAEDEEKESDEEGSESGKEESCPAVYFVFWQCLSIFFKFCNVCHSSINSLKKVKKAGGLSVTVICENGHKYTWTSQPKIGRKSLGSIAITSALYLSGIGYETFKIFSKTLNLSFVGKTSFYKTLKEYVEPTIRYNFHLQKEEIMNSLKNSEVKLAGDGQFDSPGFSAKYVTYSLMDINTNMIVDFMVLQKGMIQSNLEKVACERLLKSLTKSLNITLFLSDRHTSIRKMIKNDFKNIEHQFDVWHIAKSLTKIMKLQFKSSTTLQNWKNSIINHLWWSSATCGGNEELLLEKFLSILHHVTNVHEWENANIFKKCEHEEITEERDWIKPRSRDYQLLKKVITNEKFLLDLTHTNHFCHTSALESYHNERLKYLPKRKHFPYAGMVTRSMLAIMDHNSNVGREQIGYKLQFSKATKQWIRKKTYAAKSNSWRENIQANVLDVAGGNSLPHFEDFYEAEVPQNIAEIERPSQQEEAEMHFSRII